MSYISRNAGPRLREALAAAKEGGPASMLSLEEELAMARVSSQQAVRLYEAAWFPEEGAKEASLDVRAQAAAALRGALEFVSEIATRSARVRAMHDGTRDAQQISYVADQLQHVVEDEARRSFGDSPAAQEFLRRVAERIGEIALPQDSKAGPAAVVLIA